MTIDLAGRTAHLDRLAAELRAAHGVTVAAHAVDLACPGIGVELRDQLAGEGIRISTLMTQDELLACLQEAGATEPTQHLAQLPSDCCGGCGG